jgi:cobalamin synthase
VTANIPGPPPEDGGGGDSLAIEEGEFLQNRPPEPPELTTAKFQYAIDIIRIRRAFMSGVRHVCYVLPFLGLIMLGVWLWHILMPDQFRWLKGDEIGHLQALLFSGAISALATAIATKKI